MRAKTPAGGSAAVLFEAELALEGVDDGFDPLPDPGDLSVPGRFVLGTPEPLGAERFELLPGEAFVGEDRTRTVPPEGRPGLSSHTDQRAPFAMVATSTNIGLIHLGGLGRSAKCVRSPGVGVRPGCRRRPGGPGRREAGGRPGGRVQGPDDNRHRESRRTEGNCPSISLLSVVEWFAGQAAVVPSAESRFPRLNPFNTIGITGPGGDDPHRRSPGVRTAGAVPLRPMPTLTADAEPRSVRNRSLVHSRNGTL